MFSERIDFREGYAGGTFAEYVEYNRPKIFEEHAEVITTISD